MNGMNDDNKTAYSKGNNLLDHVKKKYHTAEDSLLYYKFPRNRGAKNDVKQYALVSNKTKHSNNVNGNAKFNAENYLHTEKSSCLQKQKLNRKEMYINCHNKKLEQKNGRICVHETPAKIGDKNNNSFSNRIRYPNYLKASSKLQERNRLYSRNYNTSRIHFKSQNGGKRTLCNSPNLYIKNRNSEPQRIIAENKTLKNNLNTTIESLREILTNCVKTQNTNKSMKYDTGYQKKQTKLENDYLKHPQIDRCNYLENTDSSEMFSKKSNQRSNHQPLDGQIIMLNDILGISANKFEIERMKILDSKQGLLELEKQNQNMVHILNELKENLKNIFTEKEFSNNKNLHYSENKKKPSKILKPVESDVAKRKFITANKTIVPLKKQSEMLREMVKFSKLVKEGSWVKDDDFATNSSQNSNSAVRGQLLINLSKVLNWKQDLCSSLISNADSENGNDVSDVQKKNNCKTNYVTKSCKLTNKGNSQEHLQQTTKVKEISVRQVLDQLRLQSSYNVDEGIRLLSFRTADEAKYPSRISTHKNISMKRTYSKRSSKTRKSHPEYSAPLKLPINKAVKSSEILMEFEY